MKKLTPQEQRRAREITKLVTWVNSPTENIEDLWEILAEMSEPSLVYATIAPDFGTEVSTIAWAELGKRRGIFPYEVSFTTTGAKPSLSIRGALGPIAHMRVKEGDA
jgi:hypothetical protein